MMMLSEFLASGERMSVAKASEELREDPSTFEGFASVWLYDDDLWVGEMDDGTFLTMIQLDQWDGDQKDVATHLFMDFYVFECCQPTTEDLTQILTDWCEWRNLEPGSADEMQHDLMSQHPDVRSAATRYEIEWLGWFSTAWERAQLKEDYAATGGRG
jgi:hypothetical protein